MPKHALHGPAYLLYGFELIFKPKLRSFVLIPFLINLLVFSGLIAVAVHLWDKLNAWVLHLLPHWLQWLHWLLWIFFILAAVLVVVYTFTFLANLIAAPFNALLAEQVETYLTGRKPAETNLWDLTKDIPRSLKREFVKLGFYLPRAIGLLLLFIIPVIQVLAAPLWFIFNAWNNTLQYLDYPMDNHRRPWQECRRLAGEKGWQTLGFGSAVLLASLIPVVNFLVMPAAVAGATAFWVEEFKEKSL